MKTTLNQKLLLLLSMSIFTKTELIVFKNIEYEEICDSKPLEFAELYEASSVFQLMYEMQNTNFAVDVSKIIKKFDDHHKIVRDYLKQLDEIKKIMIKSQLQMQQQLLFKEELQFIRIKIGTLIANEEIGKVYNQMKTQIASLISTKVTDQQNESYPKGLEIKYLAQTNIDEKDYPVGDLKSLHSKNLQYFGSQFEQLMLSKNKANYELIFKNSFQFALEEIKNIGQSGNIYFKQEICKLENILGVAIAYMTQKSGDNKNNAQTMEGMNRIIMDNFISQMMGGNFDEKLKCQSTVWQTLLRLLGQVKYEDAALKLKEGNYDKYEPLIFALIDKQKNDKCKQLIQRDHNLTFLSLLRLEWNQETLNKISTDIYSMQYSFSFINFLFGSLPSKLNQYEYFIRIQTDKNQKNNELLTEQEINLVIQHLFQIYAFIRVKNLGTQLKQSSEADDLKIVLQNILTYLETFKPTEQDSDIENEIFDIDNKIRLILIVEMLLGDTIIKQKEYTEVEYNKLESELKTFIPSYDQPTPIIYLNDNFRIQQSIIDIYTKHKVVKSLKSLYEQIRTLKTQQQTLQITITEKMSGVEIDPNIEVVDNKQIVKEVTDKVEELKKQMNFIILSIAFLKIKTSPEEAESYSIELAAFIDDIIANTQSRTQLAIFIKSIQMIAQKDSKITFNEQQFKEQIEYTLKDTITISEDQIQATMLSLRSLIITKLKQKLISNIHFGDGFIKVLDWSQQLSQTDQKMLNHDRAMFKQGTVDLKLQNKIKLLMQIDQCFMKEAIEKYQQNNIGNQVNLYKNFVISLKDKKNNLDCATYMDLALIQNFGLIKQFDTILMGLRFTDLYSILDDFEIESNVDKSKSLFGNGYDLSANKKRYLSKVFHDIYISQLHYRVSKQKGDYHNPIQEFQNQVKNCITKSFIRTTTEEFNDECPCDTLDYQQQFTLLAYQRACEDQVYNADKDKAKQFLESMNFEVSEQAKPRRGDKGHKIQYFNTILLHIFLMHVPKSKITALQLKGNGDGDILWKEHEQIDLIISKQGHIDSLMEEFKEQKNKKSLYNVLLTVETLFPNFFKTLMSDHMNEERGYSAQTFADILNVELDQSSDNGGSVSNWMAIWMKLNFANFDNSFKDFRQVVQQTYLEKNPGEDKPNFSMMVSFENHGVYQSQDTEQVLNLEKLMIYLFFTINIENYKKLSTFISKKCWMILFLYKNRDFQQNNLRRIQTEINQIQEGKNFYEKMIKYYQKEEDEELEDIKDSMFGSLLENNTEIHEKLIQKQAQQNQNELNDLKNEQGLSIEDHLTTIKIDFINYQISQDMADDFNKPQSGKKDFSLEIKVKNINDKEEIKTNLLNACEDIDCEAVVNKYLKKFQEPKANSNFNQNKLLI